ncbi:MAG TPA: Dps family protein [Aquella sp.]|nr:Dps family protein [Aquella sp.]
MLKQQFFDIKDGIPEKERAKIANSLAKVLADSYTLYLKTHNFHWNVTGPMFNSLHLMFEAQYTELALAVDLLAERIRALGFIAPATYTEFIKLTSIKEHTGDVEATKMIKYLIEAHEVVIKTTRSMLPQVEKSDDQATLDLLTQRLQVHEKTVWMLRALVL